MENFEEKEMRILTQKEFDKKIKKSNRKHFFIGDISPYVVFKNYIVDGVFNINDTRYGKTLIFENCIFQGITPFNITYYEMPLFNSVDVYFYNCKIVDYEKILNIKKYHLVNCTVIKPLPLVCPESGDFIGYKQCRNHLGNYLGDYLGDYCIAKLLIPADAKRSSAFTNKCRCSKAKVLGFYDVCGNKLKDEVVYSGYDIDFKYKVGEWVYPDSFDEDRFKECSHGIHFFMTFDEAKYY